MRETVTVTGMILIAAPLKEFDKRVEILTRDRGRITAFVRGARRPNSPLAACTIPFTFGEFQLYEGRDAYNLQSADISKYFGDIANDYDGLCYASYFCEMTQYLTRENVEAPQELLLLYVTMSCIAAGRVSLPLVRVIFEMRLMSCQGEGLELFQCLHCGSQEASRVYLSEGGLVCDECAKKVERLTREYGIHLGSDVQYTLQYIVTAPFERLYSFQVTDPVLEELVRFMKRYRRIFLPHTFRSEEFLI